MAQSRKNLQAVLAEYEGRNVKIGAEKGISYIYCDILPNLGESIKIFEKLDDIYFKQLKNSKQNDMDALRNIDAQIGNQKKIRAKEIYKKIIAEATFYENTGGEPVDIDKLMQEIDEQMAEYRRHRVNVLKANINKKHFQEVNWIPLLQREVKVIRPSIIDDDTITDESDPNIRAVIIEYAGEEKGPYWDRNEFINGIEADEEDGADE